jgi:hypothetical protein
MNQLQVILLQIVREQVFFFINLFICLDDSSGNDAVIPLHNSPSLLEIGFFLWNLFTLFYNK